MTRTDRIEAAADLARQFGNDVSDDEVARIIDAAFPELAGDSPTAWLAPMEPTEEMRSAAGEGWDDPELMGLRCAEAFRKMRQAYLRDT